MTKPIVHIINHTHWDREWFLSNVYTTHWIPTLIDKLLEISADNPAFRYLLDGQTLIIEDLLEAYPEYRPKVEQLIRNHNLTIGPYYCQPDWKLTCGESHIRNLVYGQRDAAQFGKPPKTGWLVDTFGHITQAPQIHQQFGIGAVYVWRGVPMLTPYFTWQGADGSALMAVDLFGGYRNLYGVTHAPDMADQRLQLEIDKLAPYYPTPDIPLFDGYDLEDNPEDPLSFYANLPTKVDAQLLESTPTLFVDHIRPKLNGIPTIQGELNSGKYGATFPGVYSARVYSKIMARDCANALYRVAEPLAVMAWQKGRPYQADQYEKWSRQLLQNDVHDVICGVSIDQVHEKAEDIYRKLFTSVQTDIQKSLAWIMQDFAAGQYAVSVDQLSSTGFGISQTDDNLPESTTIQPLVDLTSYSAKNWSVELGEHGNLLFNNEYLAILKVFADVGDAYSDETGDVLGSIDADKMVVHEMKDGSHTICMNGCFETAEIKISAEIKITISENAPIQWEIDLDSTGVGYRVELVFETSLAGKVMAGMPFDIVERPFSETDLLPREVGDRAKIFMGQRELNEVRSFPFHELVGIESAEKSAIVFAKGLNAYRAYEDGTLAITLRRSTEWVTRPNLANRIGDAGPYFYVPDARCERKVSYELAFMLTEHTIDSIEVQRTNAAYQTPPLSIEWGGSGDQTDWHFMQRDLPLSSLQVVDGVPQARFYNPTSKTHAGLAPKQIKTETLTVPPATAHLDNAPTARPTILSGPTWRVGENHGLPDREEIGRLHKKAATSEAAMQQAEADLLLATGADRHKAQHRVYIHHREMLEYKLSARLNEIKLANNGIITHEYLYEPDPEVTKIGWELNQLRIKRRIYDYVVAAL